MTAHYFKYIPISDERAPMSQEHFNLTRKTLKILKQAGLLFLNLNKLEFILDKMLKLLHFSHYYGSPNSA